MTSYPSRRSIRLRNHDYTQAGAYFVTLCIEQRLPLLGHVVDGEMRLSPAGAMAATVWGNLPNYYPVEEDAFVVMPNHIHGILVLNWEPSIPADSRAGTPTPAALSLSTVLQRFKTYTMHEYGTGVKEQGWPPYPGRLWQRRFHDHVIRNERDLEAIRQYIANNPVQWHLDRENPDRGH